MNLLIKAQAFVLQERDNQSKPERDNNRDDIEAHLPLGRMYIFKIDPAPQIQNEKDKDRQQCFWIRSFLFHDV